MNFKLLPLVAALSFSLIGCGGGGGGSNEPPVVPPTGGGTTPPDVPLTPLEPSKPVVPEVDTDTPLIPLEPSVNTTNQQISKLLNIDLAKVESVCSVGVYTCKVQNSETVLLEGQTLQWNITEKTAVYTSQVKDIVGQYGRPDLFPGAIVSYKVDGEEIKVHHIDDTMVFEYQKNGDYADISAKHQIDVDLLMESEENFTFINSVLITVPTASKSRNTKFVFDRSVERNAFLVEMLVNSHLSGR
ncbi:hypothetical protein [Photobacterium leiognathi]|uniref:hypothetical protein n=1 Tax=Photobacterium leiognathi TaxID=553611 RepID=UPI0029823D80|nr:hypothetical protein [Photobacterium leiognathi]